MPLIIAAHSKLGKLLLRASFMEKDGQHFESWLYGRRRWRWVSEDNPQFMLVDEEF